MSGNKKRDTSFPNNFSAGLRGSNTAVVIALFTLVLSLSAAVAVWVMWPSYVVLLNGPDASRLALVAAELQHNNIAYQYDPVSGNLLVNKSDIGYAMMLLQRHLPDIGYHSTTGNVDAIASQALSAETSRNSSLEVELAKTIASIDNVQSARVHLAIAEGRDTRESKASVVVRLMPGRRLTDAQVASISHLVAAGTTNLPPSNVSIIDQSGQLLKSVGNMPTQSLPSPHFEAIRKIEQSYVERIENILAPIVSAGEMRIQVTADVDTSNNGPVVTSHEQSNPDLQPINPPGVDSVRRLSIAVVVDDKLKRHANGQPTRVSRTTRELKNIAELTKKAVGFDVKRGDSVNVINEAFNVGRDNSRQSTVSDWSQERILDIVMLISISILSIMSVLMLLRKYVGKMAGARYLLSNNSGSQFEESGQAVADVNGAEGDNQLGNNSYDAKAMYDRLISRARELVLQNPEQVAQILKLWVREDGR